MFVIALHDIPLPRGKKINYVMQTTEYKYSFHNNLSLQEENNNLYIRSFSDFAVFQTRLIARLMIQKLKSQKGYVADLELGDNDKFYIHKVSWKDFIQDIEEILAQND